MSTPRPGAQGPRTLVSREPDSVCTTREHEQTGWPKRGVPQPVTLFGASSSVAGVRATARRVNATRPHMTPSSLIRESPGSWLLAVLPVGPVPGQALSRRPDPSVAISVARSRCYAPGCRADRGRAGHRPRHYGRPGRGREAGRSRCHRRRPCWRGDRAHVWAGAVLGWWIAHRRARGARRAAR